MQTIKIRRNLLYLCGQATVRYIAMDIFESKVKGDLPLQRGDVSERHDKMVFKETSTTKHVENICHGCHG